MASGKQQTVVDALLGREPQAIWPSFPDSTLALLVLARMVLSKQAEGTISREALRVKIKETIGVDDRQVVTIMHEMAEMVQSIDRSTLRIIPVPILVDVVRACVLGMKDPSQPSLGEYKALEVAAEALCSDCNRSGPMTAALAYALARRVDPRLAPNTAYEYTQRQAGHGESKSVVESQDVFDALTRKTTSVQWSAFPSPTKALIMTAFIAMRPDRYKTTNGYLVDQLITIVRRTFRHNSSKDCHAVVGRMCLLGLTKTNGARYPNMRHKVTPTAPRLASALQDYALYCRDAKQLPPEVYAKLEGMADVICKGSHYSARDVAILTYMLAKLAGAAVP